MKLLNDLGLSKHFRATTVKGTTSFYSDDICEILSENRSIPSVQQMREKILQPIKKAFSEDMTILTKGKSDDRVSIVCKYIGCQFRLCYIKTEKKNEEDGSLE